MDADRFDKLESKVDALHEKLDKYHEQTVRNTTDVAWLKRAVIGCFTMLFAGTSAWASKFFSGAP
jgi:hypothetical protein